MPVVGRGQVIFWDGGSLWIGLAGAGTGQHSHHAIQISCALAGSFRVTGPRRRTGTRSSMAVIPPDVVHSFDAPGAVTATIFSEPESEIGRALTAQFGDDGIVSVPRHRAVPAIRRITEAYASKETEPALDAVCQRVLEDIAGVGRLAAATDRRILSAIAAIRARLESSISLAEIARAVHLSPGRFRHLFVAQTGISFRRYVLWRRLQRALEIGVGGASWVEAAHAAHFSDAAHLTRTFRRMLGIAPSALSLEADSRSALAVLEQERARASHPA